MIEISESFKIHEVFKMKYLKYKNPLPSLKILENLKIHNALPDRPVPYVVLTSAGRPEQ